MNTQTVSIVRTSDGRLFRVASYGDPALDHVWLGVPVKLVAGEYVRRGARGNPSPAGHSRMIRRAGCTVVAECVA